MNKKEQIIKKIEKKGVVRSFEIEELGVSREYIRQLKDEGIIERAGRGIYTLPDADVSTFHSYVEAAKLVPKGIICLLSALSFHQITTQLPSRIWMAIETHSLKPTKADVPLKIVYFSKKAFTEGVEEHEIEGSLVKIYNPAKTVADCFKYRNKIGLDVATEALKDCLKMKKCSVNELWKYAKICRVTTIIKPYVEALI